MVYTYPDGTITYLAPPDGYAVDFANPTRQYVLAQYLAIGILGSIALCLTLMRSYVRFVVQKTFSWEDGKPFRDVSACQDRLETTHADARDDPNSVLHHNICKSLPQGGAPECLPGNQLTCRRSGPRMGYNRPLHPLVPRRPPSGLC